MKFDLTRKQNRFLNYLNDLMEEPLPSFKIIGKHLKMRPSNAHRMMNILVNMGYIKKLEGKTHMHTYYVLNNSKK